MRKAASRSRAAGLLVAALLLLSATTLWGAPPRPPSDVRASDHPWDAGDKLDVSFRLSPDDMAPAVPLAAGAGPVNPVQFYSVRSGGEYGGLHVEVATVSSTAEDLAAGRLTVTVGDSLRNKPFWFRVVAVGPDGAESSFAETARNSPGIAVRQVFDGTRLWLAIIGSIICGSVVAFILAARSGMQLYIRKIAGLEAIEEAVGRATEMGRSCLFVPGVLDINDIQTIAGLTILSRVSQRAAEYDAKIEVPTSKSLVMTAARETVQAAYLSAGRPDAYNEDTITYVTDEQFGYVAYLTGQMVREKPAACFYFGSFFAESLILAETGNSIGSIQVAGTAQPAQLPFFVAACDYTLIGEEFFAASAYLSGDPDQLGSLKGQDVGKLIVAGLMIVGVGLLTLASVTGNTAVLAAADYLRNVVLSSG